MKNKHLVAVYGTLKRGYGNHVVILETEGEHVLDTQTTDPYLMLNGGFPMVVNNSSDHPQSAHIHVQVYRVNDRALKWMDRIEGHPGFYERFPTALLGLDLPAWMYFVTWNYFPNADVTRSHRTPISSGLWDPRGFSSITRDLSSEVQPEQVG